MKRHDTPLDVAMALSRHAPRRVRAILDPSVGGGNLIAPLVNRLRKCRSSVYCVDSDFEAIKSVKESLGRMLPQNTKFIHSDFLSWSICGSAPLFDCIVMNPPFAATKNALHRLERPTINNSSKLTVRYIPLEAAFLCKAIDLLEPNGRLLAVVPCSVIMSDSLQWFRDELLALGSIHFIHELAPRSFPGVESRLYLLVFDKGVKRNHVTLLNHDLHEPERIVMSVSDYRVTRFDFGFVRAGIRLKHLQETNGIDLAQLRELADVIRGDIPSPKGPRLAVHSTDYQNGFWHTAKRHDRNVIVNSSRLLRRGDILISRVGRSASQSVGRGVGINGMSCSDCVIIIRPISQNQSLKLLFALRVLLSFGWARPLVERGTGACYISSRCLLELWLPINIWKRYPKQFRLFANGERTKSPERSKHAVSSVINRLSRVLP